MKLYEFLRLNEEQRYQAVRDNGKHIDTRNKDGILYQLYAINDFYVELHYNEHENILVGNMPFKQGPPLRKYLMPFPKKI